MSISPPSTEFSESETGVGLSNPHLSQSRRRLLDLVNRLHSTGVQVDIDLPQIAVIGSQSAGKSSLIESISGITLPRAAGTCTRCPTECRLSRSSEPWKCVISLRFITDTQGQTLGQVRNEPFGAIIYRKAEVEERIRRAQRAILNPSTAPKHFLEGAEDDEVSPVELSFSTNCVSLQISGPDVADLSFCDLPGLIASVGRGGNANDINLVEGLVTSYISKPSCLILLTVACETDFENQGAHRLAKENDPDGRRTIGVLTKPDRIPQGEEDRWLRFIRNEREPLENNWYCVKQPASNTLKQGITWMEARSEENVFFSSTRPWSELDSMHQRYLRTSNLTERLSSILSDLISKRLPQIQDELQISIRKTEENLRELPKAPSQDPFSEIMRLVHEFIHSLSRHLEGIPDHNGLIQALRPAQEEFRRAVRSTAPKFRPYEKRYAGERKLSRPLFLSNEEDDDSDDETDDEDTDSGGAHYPKSIYIDEVLDRATKARTRQLPGNFPFIVQENFISAITKQWDSPAKILCRTSHRIVIDHVKDLVASHFHEYGQGLLEQRVKVILTDYVKRRYDETIAKIDWLLEIEKRPFTLNAHYLADYKDKFLSHYKASRQNDNNPQLMSAIQAYKSRSPKTRSSGDSVGLSPLSPTSSNPSGISQILIGLVATGIFGTKPEDISKILPPDEMEPALIIMADVRAYFQVAYKRFVDIVPLAIDGELVRGLEVDIHSTLYNGLGINGLEGHRICKELLQESPHIADRREELQKKLERLSTASMELLQIGL